MSSCRLAPPARARRRLALPRSLACFASCAPPRLSLRARLVSVRCAALVPSAALALPSGLRVVYPRLRLVGSPPASRLRIYKARSLAAALPRPPVRGGSPPCQPAHARSPARCSRALFRSACASRPPRGARCVPGFGLRGLPSLARSLFSG